MARPRPFVKVMVDVAPDDLTVGLFGSNLIEIKAGWLFNLGFKVGFK
jgi:hypothetical protein